MDQLRHFEKESFEIQTQVKRSKDTEIDLASTQASLSEFRMREKEYTKQIESLNYSIKLK